MFKVYSYKYDPMTQQGSDSEELEDTFRELYPAKVLANDLGRLGMYAEVFNDDGESIYSVDYSEDQL